MNVSSLNPSTILVCYAGLSLAACNGASFTGSTKSDAKTSAPPTFSLSCTVSPQAINLGEKAAVAVTSVDGYQAGIFQSAVHASGTVASVLKWDAGAGFVRADSSRNEITPSAAGVWRVELRKMEGSAQADGVCELAVKTVEVPNPNPTSTPVPTPGPTPVPTSLPPVPTGTPVPTGAPLPPTCQDGQTSIGAHVAFLIDNSNSNAATDCQGAHKTGTYRGTDLYECASATNREAAALAAFDVLNSVSRNEPTNGDAASRIAVAAFPTQINSAEGWEIRSGGWIDTSLAPSRARLAEAMLFTRKPIGLTPYGAAMIAGVNLFANANQDDGRAKVAVLVTDGEPTDRDPAAVAAMSDELRSLGVEVITVFVTSGTSRATREASHLAMLRDFNDVSARSGSGAWYANRYPTFDAYAADLLGRGANLSLIEKISSKTNDQCTDRSGVKCERLIVEVENSAALTNAFKQIIGARAIRCQ